MICNWDFVKEYGSHCLLLLLKKKKKKMLMINNGINNAKQ